MSTTTSSSPSSGSAGSGKSPDGSTKRSKTSRPGLLWLIFGVIILPILLYVLWRAWNKVPSQTDQDPGDTPAGADDNSIQDEISDRIPSPQSDWVVRQYIHESGRGTNDLARRFNNILSMKHPQQRKTTSLGPTVDGYATYSSIGSAVEDYLLWWDYRSPNRFISLKSLDDFVTNLKDLGYFEDSYATYLGSLKRIVP